MSINKPFLTVCLAVLCGLLASLLALGPANGQTLTEPRLSPAEERILQQIVRDTKSADAQRAARAQKVYTRASQKAIPRLLPHVVSKGGLGGAAVGAWAVVGYELWYYTDGGPDGHVAVESEFSRSEGAGIFTGFRQGVPQMQAVFTKATFRKEGSYFKGEITGVRGVRNWYHYVGYQGGTNSSYRADGGQVALFRGTDEWWSTGIEPWSYGKGGLTVDAPPPVDYPRTVVIPFSIPASSGNWRWCVKDFNAPSTTAPNCVGPSSLPTDGSTHTFTGPTYQTRGSTAQQVPADSPAQFRTTPQEAKDLVDTIEADPEYDPNWQKPWLDPGFKTPDDPAERERLWGPIVKEYPLEYPGWYCQVRAYGVEICEKDGEKNVSIKRDYIDWTEYPDGTKKFWLTPDQKPADWPIDDPMLDAHPWGPFWKPDPNWPGLRPPGNPLEDERIFGPGQQDPRGGDAMIIFHYQDGTVGMYDKDGSRYWANGQRKIWMNADRSYSYAGPNEKFKGAIPVCDSGSSNVYTTVYPDGVTVQRTYPEGVTSEQTQTTKAICESWMDAKGNPIQPGDPAMYPKHFLKDYEKAYPEVFQK